MQLPVLAARPCSDPPNSDSPTPSLGRAGVTLSSTGLESLCQSRPTWAHTAWRWPRRSSTAHDAAKSGPRLVTWRRGTHHQRRQLPQDDPLECRKPPCREVPQCCTSLQMASPALPDGGWPSRSRVGALRQLCLDTQVVDPATSHTCLGRGLPPDECQPRLCPPLWKNHA